MTIGAILLIILVLALIGAIPTQGYGSGQPVYVGGGLGLVVVIIVILLVLGRI